MGRYLRFWTRLKKQSGAASPPVSGICRVPGRSVSWRDQVLCQLPPSWERGLKESDPKKCNCPFDFPLLQIPKKGPNCCIPQILPRKEIATHMPNLPNWFISAFKPCGPAIRSSLVWFGPLWPCWASQFPCFCHAALALRENTAPRARTSAMPSPRLDQCSDGPPPRLGLDIRGRFFVAAASSDLLQTKMQSAPRPPGEECSALVWTNEVKQGTFATLWRTFCGGRLSVTQSLTPESPRIKRGRPGSAKKKATCKLATSMQTPPLV